ncbi:hypothetical protein OESDEN_13908 [Oesophagostomum dentatum]|uniref:Uncharacterized protein n=1 Tax=Oesophagostomum dentatum TaxID=61180 RepID=A0A0B1SR20_OESDE|nr:hypothetical protein OESDEN_13908 [Oesophagostomum dentatum]
MCAIKSITDLHFWKIQEDCFLGEICDRGFCCPIPRPVIGLQSEAPRALPKPSRDKPLTTESSPNDADELCPDGSVWTKRCRQEDDCNTTKEVCAEGKCCASEFDFTVFFN